MFSDKGFSGDRLTLAYTETRMRWEPIIEVTQIKGDGETHPLLSSEDEFAGFENWDVANIDGSTPKEDWMLQYEYGRSALKLGLKLGNELGANPYKFGLTGASDTHTALSTTREENYFGKYAKTEPSPNRHNHEVIPADDPALRIMTSQEVASGLTAVGARKHPRSDLRGVEAEGSLRDNRHADPGACLRRMGFRGGRGVATRFHLSGLSRGVPMGDDLRKAPAGKAPTLKIRALRDPDGANLDRIQIIKGWLDSDGETHERIYDVAVSDGRKVGALRFLPAQDPLPSPTGPKASRPSAAEKGIGRRSARLDQSEPSRPGCHERGRSDVARLGALPFRPRARSEDRGRAGRRGCEGPGVVDARSSRGVRPCRRALPSRSG